MSTAHLVGIDYHRWMIQDTKRTVAFRDALQVLVKPGDVVVDIGSGTGILSLFAAEAGASKVYAVESNPIATIISKLAKENGYGDIIVPIHEDARKVQLPEKADILVTDCMGHFVLSDRMLGVLADCKHMLKDDGIVIPNSTTLEVAPARLGPLLHQIHDWEEPLFGFDFSKGRDYAENDAYRVQISRGMVVEQDQIFTEIFITEPPVMWQKTMTWTFSKPTIVDSVIGWFTAHMGGDVRIETGPGIQSHWGQLAFPVPLFQAQPGEKMEFTLTANADDMEYAHYRWEGTFYDKDGDPILEFKRDQDKRFNPKPDEWHQ